jgi:hypothetical protein
MENEISQQDVHSRLFDTRKKKRNLLQVCHSCVEVMEGFWKGDGSHGSLPVFLWQINNTRPEGHLDFDKSFITVSQ